MPDSYFGNNPEAEPIVLDGHEYWRMYADLPGTAVEDACGDEELNIPCDEFEKPEQIGLGCDPVTAIYISTRSCQPKPQQQKQYPKEGRELQ